MNKGTGNQKREPEDARVEYCECNAQTRQLDNRIWGIHGLYFTASAALLAVILKDGVLPPIRVQLFCTLIVTFLSLSKEVIIDHLIWFNDLLLIRAREIEKEREIETHERIEMERILKTSPNQPSDQRRDWRIVSSRIVMTNLSIANVIIWCTIPIYSATIVTWPACHFYILALITKWILPITVIVCFAIVYGSLNLYQKKANTLWKATRNP